LGVDAGVLAAAVEALSWMELEDLKPSHALTRAVRQLDIRDERAIASAYSLVEETVRRKSLIEKMLSTALPSLLPDLKVGVKSFLQIYIYTTRLAPKEGESGVELVKAGREILGWRVLHPVEGFLGRLLTLEPTSLYDGLADVEKVALETCQPSWFVRYCYRLLGRREALKLLRKYAEGLPAYISLNTLKGSEATLTAELKREKITLEGDPRLKYLYLASNPDRLLWRTNAYRKGLFYLTDKGSYLAASTSEAKEGMTALTLSVDGAAVTAQLAQLMGNRGEIFSAAVPPKKAETLEKEFKRLGVGIAKPLNFNPHKPLPVHVEADVVLVNPPSSRTGLFGSEPSAKWSFNPENIENYRDLQKGILGEGAAHVKPEGSLIYITSSITLEENEMVVEHFLNSAPDFKLERVDGVGRPALRGLRGCVRIYPHLDNANGCFIAKMKRVS